MNVKKISCAISCLALFTLFIACKTPVKEQPKKSNEKIEVGQKWKYENRIGEDSSLITILKIEVLKNKDTVVHISVDGVKVINPIAPSGYSDHIQHIPFLQKSLRSSLTSLVSENNSLPDFSEGYTLWKESMDEEGAGIFTESVKEVINMIEEMQRSLTKPE